MKKIFFAIAFVLASVMTYAQTGLEGVIVEKVDASSVLAGATTYRVFLDMEENWGFSSIKGNSDYTLRIETTGSWWNGGFGAPSIANDLDETIAPADFLNHDSWISAGAASTNTIGIPGGAGASVAGTPAPVQAIGLDLTPFGAGVRTTNMVATGGSWAAFQTGGAVGPDATNLVMIGQFTTDGDFSFELNVTLIDPATGNGVFFVPADNAAAPADVVFPDLAYSSVEVNEAPSAEITDPASGSDIFSERNVTFTVSATDPNTDPAFNQVDNVEYRVNGGTPVSIGTASTFQVFSGAEGTTLDLEVRATDNGGLTGNWSSVYTYNVVEEVIPPSITALNQDQTSVFDGETVNFDVVFDQGSGDNVTIEWFVDGTSEQSGAGSTFAWIADIIDPAVEVRVVVTTEAGTDEATASVKVISSAASYKLGSIEEFCYESNTVCIPVTNIVAFPENVTGFDLDITYDPALLVPTGQVVVNVNPGGASMDNTEFHYNIVTPGVMHLTVALDNNSNVDDVWNSVDRELFCVQFAKTASWTPTSSTSVGAENIVESYRTSVSDPKVAAAGTYNTIVDNEYNGFVKFWADYSPLYSDDPDDLDIETFISNLAGTYSVTTAADGSFAYDITNGTDIVITKDVANSAQGGRVMTVYNGYDGYLTAQLLVNDARFQPSAIQVIAMDVNLDGVVSAGDLSQINQRGVRAINYFRAEGVTGQANDIDWLFINEKQLLDAMDMRISSTFPEDDGTGYSKYRVPSVPASFDLSEAYGNDLSCPVVIDNQNTYLGILLGDIDGSYKDLAPDGRLKSVETASVVFDLSDAIYEEDFVDVPVKYLGTEDVKSLSFVIDYNKAQMSLQTIANLNSEVEALHNEDETYLYLVSYSLTSYDVEEAIFSIRFYAPNGIKSSDFHSTEAFVNGVEVETSVTKSVENATGIADFEAGLRVYPNPASDVLNIEVAEEVSLEIIDVQGRVITKMNNVVGTERIDVNQYEAGVYMLKLYNENNAAVKRIVIQ